MQRQPGMVDSIFIGDRVVDVCASIDIYCKAMSTGIVPMIETRYPFSLQMECTLCIMGDKRALLHRTAQKNGLTHVVLEETDSAVNPASMAEELSGQGFVVDVIDFKQGVAGAIRQAGSIFNRQKIAEKRAAQYEKELAEARGMLPRKRQLRVLVLMGLSHHKRRGDYLLVERSGGDVDASVLQPAGCVSVGDHLAQGQWADLGFTLIDTLDALDEAAPDMIALLGDTFVPQKFLQHYSATHCESTVPALRNHAVFTLPDCSLGAPVAIPDALQRWTAALNQFV